MNSLLPRLKEMLEFEEGFVEKKADWYVDVFLVGASIDEQVTHDAFMAGERETHARLKPLLTRLVECVEALEYYNHEGWMGPAKRTLQALRDEVEK